MRNSVRFRSGSGYSCPTRAYIKEFAMSRFMLFIATLVVVMSGCVSNLVSEDNSEISAPEPRAWVGSGTFTTKWDSASAKGANRKAFSIEAEKFSQVSRNWKLGPAASYEESEGKTNQDLEFTSNTGS